LIGFITFTTELHRMRRSLVASFAIAALALSAPKAEAQACAAGNAQDACEKARDFFLYMAPQLGTSLAGGSHTLGIGTNLGGFPHFALAIRANIVQGDLPTLDDVVAGPAAVSTIASEEAPIGFPTVDFALGITKGISLGVTRIGGIDLIGGVTYLPELQDDGTSITAQDGSIAIGLGARVGLLQQSALIPGVSFSYMKRNLPVMDFSFQTDPGNTAENDQFNINDFTVNTTSWRLSAQKNLLLLQFGAGIGGDTYDFSTSANGSVTEAGVTEAFGFVADQTINRTTMYGSLGINLFLVKIVAEVGQVTGGTVVTYNEFVEPADKTRMYGTVGVRISF
jgi:hypothetical protein